MRKFFALFVLLVGFAAHSPLTCAETTPAPFDALTRYEEGKKLYDAGDYVAARGKFAEAARRDPDNARWFYNLGLTQRQLDNFQAAREAFLRARQLDPEYKKKEINDKLKSMGFDPASSTEEQPRSSLSVGTTDDATPSGELANAQEDDSELGDHTGLIVFGAFAAVLITLVGFGLRRLAKEKKQQPQVTINGPAIAAARERLDQLSAQLIPLEHSMRLGEHADLRSLLEHATQLEAEARQGLEKAKQGNRTALQRAQQQINEASRNAQQATALANKLYGDAAFTGQGERIGCFFCARPLANPEVRQPVSMKRGAATDTVLSCPDCAALAARGEAPRIRTGSGLQQHWSDDLDFDPYTARHAKGSNRRVPAWDFRPAQPISTLAQQASGGALLGAGAVGALAGAGTAMATSHLLDLDAARGADHAQQAASETANRVQERTSSSSDHS